MINETQYIKEKLPKTEILCQLAEESAELAQAALKLRRAIDKTNPTPISVEAAENALLEEYGDVINCLDVLLTATQNAFVVKMRKEKMVRWADRLKRLEENNG